MKNFKAITTIPGWANRQMEGSDGQPDDINSNLAAYAYVPLLGRALRLRCNSLIRAPIEIRRIKDNKKVEWPFPVSPRDLIWRTEASLLLTGGVFLERVLRKSGATYDLNWVNPVGMKVTYDKEAKQMKFRQENGGSWSQDEMVYIKEFSLSSDIQPTDCAAKSALTDAGLLRYQSRFAAHFFKTGAMPITMVHIEGLLDENEARRTQRRIQRMITGVRNAFRLLVLNKAIKPEVISQPLSELAIPDLFEQAMSNVSWAFDVNKTLLTDAANRATAMEYRLGFYQDTVEPRGIWMAEKLNEQVFSPLGLRFAFAFEELDIYQEDEEQRASSVEALTRALNTNPMAALAAMGIMGFELSEEQYQTIADLVPQEVPEEITNMVVEDVQMNPKNIDLEKWMRKSLGFLKRKGSADCTFVSDFIPEETYVEISAQLKHCKTAKEVRQVFARSMTMVEKPQDDIEKLLKAIEAEVRLSGSNSSMGMAIPQINLSLEPEIKAVVPDESIQVFVTPTVKMPEPNLTVNVEPTPITVEAPKVDVNVNPTPINMNVQPAEVIINHPKRTVMRDEKGRIIRIIEST